MKIRKLSALLLSLAMLASLLAAAVRKRRPRRTAGGM